MIFNRSALRPSSQAFPWNLGLILIALCVIAPVVSLLGLAMQGTGEHWAHLFAYVLPDSLTQTVLLLTGVGLVGSFLGVGGAWLMTAYDFPLRRMLSWALLLPLAVPTYIVAYAYLDVLHPIGPVQTAIRAVLGFDSPRDFRLPDLRNLPGAIFLLGFVLYPYVYLTTRSMFSTQAANLLEVARLLGHGPWSTFFRVALPLARPAIAVGVSLILLETLNDIGASEFLGIRTLTVSIYTTWISRSDLGSAAQIAMSMLVLVTLLITVERYGRRGLQYTGNRRAHPVQARRLHGPSAWLATALGCFPVVIGFVVPAVYLLSESLERLTAAGMVSDQLISAALNTIWVAVVATAVTVACGLVVAWSIRITRRPTTWLRAAARIGTLGYALPGTVLALGLLYPVMAGEHLLSGALDALGMPVDHLILMGTPLVLIVAYTIRFLAISIGSIEAGLARIPASIEQASRLLGEGVNGTLRRVHLPLLRPALASAALLVFVDSMKELPATLMLRPMNFETLATWLYGEAARGTYEEGAIAALGIVLAGLIPVILLARVQTGGRPH